MRWKTDEVDLWCRQWASQRRSLLGLKEPEPKDRLGKLRCTLAAIRQERDGAGQGAVSQSFPEVYIGAPPNYPLLVNRAWKRMKREWREVIEAHYVYPGFRVKEKAWMLDLSYDTFFHYVNYGKNFIHSYVILATEPESDSDSKYTEKCLG